jgi:hypothetical protein
MLHKIYKERYLKTEDMVETVTSLAAIENRGVVFIAAPVPNVVIKTFALFNDTASSAETSVYNFKSDGT